MFEELWWFIVICFVLAPLFGTRDKPRTRKDEPMDPNVFYYEDLHGKDDDEF